MPNVITFDDTQSTRGPGHLIPNLLIVEGAVFGERFAGQTVSSNGDHDQVDGHALSPLTVMPGASGQNLSVVYFEGNNILNGYGAAGFPKRHAQGEGAISFLFDEDQASLAFQVRGGELGQAKVTFLTRDGKTLATVDIPNTGEGEFGFSRTRGLCDIAGVLITNTDPQGIALDNVRYGTCPGMS